MTKFQKTSGMSACGTSLQDYMVASYYDLVKVFGEPTYTDGYVDEKVNFEWVLSNGKNVVTIYNWKDYDGGRRAQDDLNYRWHIGGHNSLAASDLIEYFHNELNEVVA